jgi:hypothetical protein
VGDNNLLREQAQDRNRLPVPVSYYHQAGFHLSCFCLWSDLFVMRLPLSAGRSVPGPGLTINCQSHTFSDPVSTGQRRFDSLRLRALENLPGFQKTAKAGVACGSLTKGMPMSQRTGRFRVNDDER